MLETRPCMASLMYAYLANYGLLNSSYYHTYLFSIHQWDTELICFLLNENDTCYMKTFFVDSLDQSTMCMYQAFIGLSNFPSQKCEGANGNKAWIICKCKWEKFNELVHGQLAFPQFSKCLPIQQMTTILKALVSICKTDHFI